MKELSEKEKAKRYDEAIEVARKYWNSPRTCIDIDVLPELFPEIRELDDEEIRKGIIEYLEQSQFGEEHYQIDDDIVRNYIAWLEKQKEQRNYRKLYRDIAKSEWFKNAYEGKSLGGDDEKKPAEWSDDYNEENLQIRFAFYTYKDDPSVIYLSNVFVEETSRNHGLGTRILKAAEKAAEAIGAITIRLKVKRDNPANAWYRKHGYNYLTSEGDYDWLEKNLEYMKPNKQEWSEEDKEIIEALNDYVKNLDILFSEIKIGDKDILSKEFREKVQHFLKSLKDRLQPQKQWKPSDKDIKLLKELSDGKICPDNYRTRLYEIINNLKNL